MKNLLLPILLVSTNLLFSQENNPFTNIDRQTLYPFTGEELDRAYFRQVQCDQDLTNALSVVDELHSVVVNLNKNIQDSLIKIDELEKEKERLQTEKEKKIAELATLKEKGKKVWYKSTVFKMSVGFAVGGYTAYRLK